jgi:glutathione-regulated potassium-efflux system protein KefB
MHDASLHITRELFESSVTMAEHALLTLGVKQDDAAKAVSDFRARDTARLAAQFATGDMHAGAQHSFGGRESDDAMPDDA